MILYDSIPYWPEGVHLTKEGIRDEVLRVTHAMNETSRVILQEVDGQKTIADIAETVCQTYNWPLEVVKPDVWELVQQLNQNYLINLKLSWKQKLLQPWITLLFFLRTLHVSRWEIKKRIPIDSKRRFWVILAQVALAILQSMAAGLLFSSLLVGVLFSQLGQSGWVEGLAFFFGIFIGFLLHEMGHILSFFLVTPKEVQPFFATRRLAFQVVRQKLAPNQEWIISLSGPILPVFCALLLLPCGIWGTVGESFLFSFWIFVLSLSVHILALIPPSADAKRILEAIAWMRLAKEMNKEGSHEKH
jgi:hypothetical protein